MLQTSRLNIFPSSLLSDISDYNDDYAEDEVHSGQGSSTALVVVSLLAGAQSVILGGLFIRWCVRHIRPRRSSSSQNLVTVVNVGEGRGNGSGIIPADLRDQLHSPADLA